MIAMGRTLNEMIDALPKRRRARIDARYRELKDDVESLRALRRRPARRKLHGGANSRNPPKIG
jgi:hypothetical protein